MHIDSCCIFLGTGEIHMKAKLRASLTQRRIQDLSASMHMKEELIKQLDQTGAFQEQ